MIGNFAETTPVLIVGAGPTGLVLALSLSRQGIAVRLIDASEGPGRQSRAMVVQARTLEFYRQFGVAEQIIEQGVKIGAAHLREGSQDGGNHVVAELDFTDIGSDQSPYPFLLAYPQDEHEQWLIGLLGELGVNVEWNTRLTGFREKGDGVVADLSLPDGGAGQIAARYICGCDGGHSAVRKALGVDFSGGTYKQLYYVADVKIAGGFERDLFINLGKNTLALMLPVRSRGVQRLIGLVPTVLADADSANRDDIGFEDLRSYVEPLVDVQVTEVNWFSTYRVDHRVAGRFMVGRAFLLGDAGHVHSPAGAQGMNTGIGDAVNLGWKLAQALDGRAGPVLLESYEIERIAFARQLVSTTDAAFKRVVAGGAMGVLARRVVVPLIASLAAHSRLGRETLFRTLSQIAIHYADSPLSQGRAGRVAGGDRLPWLGRDVDNFAPLASLNWQVHVYGDVEAALTSVCATLHLPLHVFDWIEIAKHVGLARDAVYLVRPDGHVALAAHGGGMVTALQDYVGEQGLRFND